MDTATIRYLLENKKLKIIIDSPDNAYCFVYFSTISIDRLTKKRRLVRSYQLIDRVRGQLTSEPWGDYHLDKQTILVTNLINLSGYQIAKISVGWRAACSLCGRVTRRGHWQNAPSKCEPKPKNNCHALFNPADIDEVIYNLRITVESQGQSLLRKIEKNAIT